jgi:ribosomal protein L37E
MIKCKRCGLEKEPHPVDKHLCAECVKAENTRVTYYRQHQDWIAEAAAQGLDLWVQQPGETQWEFTVWTKYRDSYPGKRPSYASVAEELGTTYNAVKKIAQRWNFQVRMQAWMAECDRITLLQRRNEILQMNKEHIEMSAKLRDKLKSAIENINPLELKPKDIAPLMKIAADLERKAMLDNLQQDEAKQPLVASSDNPYLKKAEPKQGELKEIVDILVKSGALVGIKQTKTTEVSVVDNALEVEPIDD